MARLPLPLCKPAALAETRLLLAIDAIVPVVDEFTKMSANPAPPFAPDPEILLLLIVRAVPKYEVLRRPTPCSRALLIVFDVMLKVRMLLPIWAIPSTPASLITFPSIVTVEAVFSPRSSIEPSKMLSSMVTEEQALPIPNVRALM